VTEAGQGTHSASQGRRESSSLDWSSNRLHSSTKFSSHWDQHLRDRCKFLHNAIFLQLITPMNSCELSKKMCGIQSCLSLSGRCSTNDGIVLWSLDIYGRCLLGCLCRKRSTPSQVENQSETRPKMRSGLVKSWSFESQPPIATRGPAQLPPRGPAGESTQDPRDLMAGLKARTFTHSGPFVTWPAHLESVPKAQYPDPSPTAIRFYCFFSRLRCTL
jgi:hypothetical protein